MIVFSTMPRRRQTTESPVKGGPPKGIGSAVAVVDGGMRTRADPGWRDHRFGCSAAYIATAVAESLALNGVGVVPVTRHLRFARLPWRSFHPSVFNYTGKGAL